MELLEFGLVWFSRVVMPLCFNRAQGAVKLLEREGFDAAVMANNQIDFTGIFPEYMR